MRPWTILNVSTPVDNIKESIFLFKPIFINFKFRNILELKINNTKGSIGIGLGVKKGIELG